MLRFPDPASVASHPGEAEPPLCVDLDGALLATDTLWESVALLARTEPMSLFYLPLWLSRGKAHLKRQLAARVAPAVDLLPYREDVLSFLRNERERGRRVLLTTGADRKLAERVAEHLDLFSMIVASDGRRNLTGRAKLMAIRQHMGGGEFDYIGNSPVDLPLWRAARRAILVGPSRKLMRQARAVSQVDRTFSDPENRWKALLAALRVRQWVKNILLFVPLLLAHRLGELDLLLGAASGFVAFSLCASGVYLTNDWLDLENDRRHPIKKERPFASGRLSIRTAWSLIPGLFAAGLGLAWFALSPLFFALLVSYVAVSTGYSLRLKQVVIVDVLVLAGLYTLRVIAGGAATGVVLSPWLLAFSLFLFFSLALAKRYSELELRRGIGEALSSGRGYLTDDLPIIRSIGPASGYIAVLVLALYINSEMVTELYREPAFLWPVTPLMLFWITHIWFMAHRGVLSDDPIVFTLRDPTSWAVGAGVVLLLAMGTLW